MTTRQESSVSKLIEERATWGAAEPSAVDVICAFVCIPRDQIDRAFRLYNFGNTIGNDDHR